VQAKRILGINFSGFAAWWLWRTIYLSKLPRLEKKLRVAFDSTLDLIFSKDLVQFQEIRAPMISRSLPYPGRYTHRVAISDHRLLALDGGRVTVRWKDTRAATSNDR
jgi:NADH dehydrogenase